jgi:hypothetical protein
VSLLESVVLANVVEIVSSDDDGSLHLGRKDDAPIYIIIINIYIIEKNEKESVSIARVYLGNSAKENKLT